MACAHKSTSTLLALALDGKKKVDGTVVATVTGFLRQTVAHGITAMGKPLVNIAGAGTSKTLSKGFTIGLGVALGG